MRDVIGASGGCPVAGQIIDGHCAVGASGTSNGDQCAAAILVHAEAGVFKLERSSVVGEQARKIILSDSVERVEAAADQYLAVRLNSEAAHTGFLSGDIRARASAGVEGGVQGTVHVESDEVFAADPIHHCIITAHQALAVHFCF